jgi:hypothetical protein
MENKRASTNIRLRYNSKSKEFIVNEYVGGKEGDIDVFVTSNFSQALNFAIKGVKDNDLQFILGTFCVVVSKEALENIGKNYVSTLCTWNKNKRLGDKEICEAHKLFLEIIHLTNKVEYAAKIVLKKYKRTYDNQTPR